MLATKGLCRFTKIVVPSNMKQIREVIYADMRDSSGIILQDIAHYLGRHFGYIFFRYSADVLLIDNKHFVV